MAIEDYLEHLPLRVPPEDVHEMTRLMLARCPVVHSDVDGGFWLINRHADVVRVLQDWRGFANGNAGVRVPHDPPGVNRPPMPPIDWNPPMHRRVREVMNPFLSPQALAEHEDGFRSIIGELLDTFAPDGRCDLATQFSKVFPARITAQELLGVTDQSQLEDLRTWNRRLSYDLLTEDPVVLAEVQRNWSAWCHRLVDARRTDPRADIMSALIDATVDDRPLLSDVEVVGAIQILIAGGFSTTSEATSNIVVRLIDDPELEARLRERPELIPKAIEEILRADPPVLTRPRRCTHDVEIGGEVMRAGERVLVNYLGANVDPDEWDHPDDFVLDRARNRSMTFSAGPHRCIGSNVARTSLRIMVEELLARVTKIQYADDRRERRISTQPGGWRMVDSFPITYTPLDPRQPLV